MDQYAIPAAALIIAVSTFAATQWNARRASDTDYAESMGLRVSQLEKDLEASQNEVNRLRSENFDLLKRLLFANGGPKT